MELAISTGRSWKSRETKVWHNVKITWPALVEKLSTTVRTPESFKEYTSLGETKAGKEKQAEIKDRGGFVGGYLKDGKRSPNTVVYRQLITLDIDFANLDFWSDFVMFYDCAAAIHSTHKHGPKTPRFRLIIPINRKVTSEEYEAIARKIAGTLDINLFDPTTFQPERLMYWPTTSKDGVYFFKEQKGEFLNADQVLNSYEDWQDISSWPKPDSEGDLIKSLRGKQGNPVDKPGLIGAFCRAYNIHEAIEKFLPELYEATGVDDRYTYAEGSAAAGAIVYDDSFLYSHHGTDPIHGQLVNSFDLVRLHKFGNEDVDDGEKEITKRKSHKLMTDFASSQKEVVKEVGVKALGFDDTYDDNDWLGELTVDKYGKYENTIPNFELIISNDPELKGKFKKDLFNQREIIYKPVPWSKITGSFNYTDEEDASLRHYLEKVYDIYHATKCKDALAMVFNTNTFHPVIDYLDSLDWDGENRIDTLLIDYMGADDTAFNRHAIRKWLTAAVARVYNPGIKFDYILTLLGKQGIGKSTFFSKLGRTWFSDSFVGVDGNKAFEQLHGVWIMEIAELAGFKRAEIEAVKHFITKQIDSFRVAYGTKKSDFPRQLVFGASVNVDKPFSDTTGNRRYWPVTVTGFGEFDLSDMPVDQIWAEAKLYYKTGEKLYFDALIEEEAREIQARHTEEDDREGLIVDYLNTLLPVSWIGMSIHERRAWLSDKDGIGEIGEVPRLSVCVAEIWAEVLRGEPKDMGPHNTKYIHQILSNIPGWEKAKSNLTFPVYGKQRAYVVSGNVKKHNKRKADRI